MVFSSYIFIFLFLPVVLSVYFLLSKVNKTAQHIFLVLASLFFYAFFNVAYLIIIVTSIVVNYLLARILTKYRKYAKFLLLLGIVFNIGLLGYYKYYDFFVNNLNAMFGADFILKNILLPLGISFFTFQQFSFLISIYKNEENVENFVDYCLFVSFFPQLVAGPIVLYSEMIPQFRDEKNRFINYDNIVKGIYIFIIGLFKKIVIADTLALFVSNGFNLENIGLIGAWVTSLSYTMQIYFDFSGYSDMAVGLGRMFNIKIPDNFISPYKSKSITEFWRRWHITLGRALGTYIYIPLGGNRKGSIRTYINLFITFLISGLWHGAAWTFIVWGIAHGLCSIFERLFRGFLSKIPDFIRIIATFNVINFLWVLFRAPDFVSAQNIYRGMLNFSNIGISQLAGIADDGWINLPTTIDILYILSVIAVLCIVVFRLKSSQEILNEFSPDMKSVIFTVAIFCVSVIHLSKESVFIYFNF